MLELGDVNHRLDLGLFRLVVDAVGLARRSCKGRRSDRLDQVPLSPAKINVAENAAAFALTGSVSSGAAAEDVPEMGSIGEMLTPRLYPFAAPDYRQGEVALQRRRSPRVVDQS